ncbi:MAG: GNAT family N-acetyltransferase [Chloroflexi bacterium]|nr:GNAT family N-acetyltransferase [Chloroflexota bacterium]MDA1010688.1 GNAT family N-acetyltransferase [Chloroflexota bacterium]MQC25747.1 GNAT family N-acetyltransferase [Chloroflexota bacterium]
MATTIRPAAPADAAALAALIVAAFEEYRGWLVPPSAALAETPATIEAQLTGSHGAVLAEVDGVAAGCVLFNPQGLDLYFGRLSVLPAYRRTGLAEALITAVEAEAARRSAAGVVLSVRIALPANQRLFERAGYVEVRRQAHPGFDHPTWIDMRKSL